MARPVVYAVAVACLFLADAVTPTPHCLKDDFVGSCGIQISIPNNKTFDDVKAVIAEPAQVNYMHVMSMMQGIEMMVVWYKADKLKECCEAVKALSKHEFVTYMEVQKMPHHDPPEANGKYSKLVKEMQAKAAKKELDVVGLGKINELSGKSESLLHEYGALLKEIDSVKDEVALIKADLEQTKDKVKKGLSADQITKLDWKWTWPWGEVDDKFAGIDGSLKIVGGHIQDLFDYFEKNAKKAGKAMEAMAKQNAPAPVDGAKKEEKTENMEKTDKTEETEKDAGSRVGLGVAAICVAVAAWATASE